MRGGEPGFSKLLENLRVGVVVHAPDTTVLYSNQLAAKLLGLTAQSIKGRLASDTHWRFIHEDGSTMQLSEFPVNRVKNSLAPIKNQLVGIFRPEEDRVIWALCNAYPELNAEGQLSEIVVNFTDITEEKKIREDLSELTRLLQAALNQSQAGVVIADARTNRLKYINQAAFMMKLGLPGEKIEDIDASKLLSFWKMTHLDDSPVKSDEMPLNRALTQKEKISQEFKIKLPNFEERVVWVNAAPIYGPSGNIIAGILVLLDTTDRHQLETELKRARATAETATIMKSRFLDVAAHELRTPITVFTLLIQFAEQQLERGNPVQLSTLKRLAIQAERITRLVVDLLDVSRLERGVLTLNLKPTDISSPIHDALEDFKLRRPNRKISCTKPGTPTVLNIDSLRIYQVISNLLDNASKYTAVESPIEVDLTVYPKTVRLSVKDYGPGISDQEQGVLFTPFSRGSVELADRSGGLGLGLFICRRIIELHRGTIGLKSKLGEGSTFFFELPREEKL